MQDAYKALWKEANNLAERIEQRLTNLMCKRHPPGKAWRDAYLTQTEKMHRRFDFIRCQILDLDPKEEMESTQQLHKTWRGLLLSWCQI